MGESLRGLAVLISGKFLQTVCSMCNIYWNACYWLRKFWIERVWSLSSWRVQVWLCFLCRCQQRHWPGHCSGVCQIWSLPDSYWALNGTAWGNKEIVLKKWTERIQCMWSRICKVNSSLTPLTNTEHIMNIIYRLLLFQIHLITGDVTVKEDVERIVSSSVSHFGKLDILVSI